MTDRAFYRVIDANFNRVREGLRVCEEFVRFYSNARGLTGDIKSIRNRVGTIYSRHFKGTPALISSRDVSKDVGRIGFAFEKKRGKPFDLFSINLQRSKEAMRVLEEFSKLLDERLSDEFRALRFEIYDIEKKALKKLQAIL